MRKMLGVVALLSGLVALIPSGPANALSCPIGDVCSIELTNTNIVELAGIDIRVTVDNTGTNTILSYELISSPLSNTPIGLDTFFYDSSTLISPCPAGFNCNFNGDNADGFGTFASHKTLDSGGTGGLTGDPVILTLAGLVTNFDETPGGGEFATHIRFAGIPAGASCSGWVSDGTTSDSSSAAGCVPTDHRVPEPGAMTLVGLGLVSLAGLFTRRK
jgi:PEP-CTERM motif